MSPASVVRLRVDYQRLLEEARRQIAESERALETFSPQKEADR